MTPPCVPLALSFAHAAPLRRLTRLASSRAYPPRQPTCTARPCSTLPTPPAARNFFANTPLTRLPSSVFPNSLDRLLATVSASDRFLPVWNEQPLITHPPSRPSSTAAPPTPVLWTPAHLSIWLREARLQSNPSFSPLTVALAQSAAAPHRANYFAVDVSHSAAAPVAAHQRPTPLRRVLPLLASEADAALVAHAKALISWHASAGYCSRCGGRTVSTRGGAARACPSARCTTRNIYPRVMPSVLVLVLRKGGREVLLGRQARWPEGRYSVVAGFAEIFESLEQTVAREVREETGVLVDPVSVRYHSSQPWPSAPQASLMSGFRAYVTGDEQARVTVDETELQDARWFRKEWLREQLVGEPAGGAQVSIPGHTSLAHRLIMEWLEEDV